MKAVENNDIPEVVICLEPGIDTNVLRQYGYNNVKTYYRGATKKFIGWNGNTTGKKSSKEILEEALIVKDEHIKRSNMYLTLSDMLKV